MAKKPVSREKRQEKRLVAFQLNEELVQKVELIAKDREMSIAAVLRGIIIDHFRQKAA